MLKPDAVMLDFETLDTSEKPALLSIGAVSFNILERDTVETLRAPGRGFYQTFNLDDQLRVGRTISQSTLTWWLQQSEEARRLFSQLQTGPISQSIMSLFHNFCRASEATELWCNGAADDGKWYATFCADFGLTPFFRYSKISCARTIYKLAKVKPDDFKVPGLVAHDAIDDCINQILKLQHCYRLLTKEQIEEPSTVEEQPNTGVDSGLGLVQFTGSGSLTAMDTPVHNETTQA